MPLRWTWRLTGLVALGLLAAALVIAALTAGADDPPSVAIGYVPVPTITPTPRYPKEFSLPGGVTDQSAMIMIQGGVERRLTVWSLNGGDPPVEVDRGVNLSPLLPDPSGTRALYTAGSAVMVLDVPAQRARIVASLPEDGQIIAAQWSPNGQMIAYVVQLDDERVSYVAWQDASQPAQVMLHTPNGLPVDVAWLPDGRPVTVSMGIGPVGGLEARYMMYDWLKDERVMLPADVKTVQLYSPWRSPGGDNQLYLPPASISARYNVGCADGAIGLAGPEWLYVAASGSGKPHEIAFEMQDVFLDWPTWLQDGRVLMRGMSNEACLTQGSGLYIGTIGEMPKQLVRAKLSYDLEESDHLLWGVSYALSPDQEVVAWADTDLDAERSTIYLTEIDSGTTTPIFETPPVVGGNTPFTFQDQEMILHLVWLP